MSFLFLTSRIWLSFAYRPRTLLPIYKIPPSVIIDVQKVSIGYKKPNRICRKTHSWLGLYL